MRRKKTSITIADLSKITGVCPQTLYNWRTNKPVLFDVVLTGVAFSQTTYDVEDMKADARSKR